jgi:hypothetical protein
MRALTAVPKRGVRERNDSGDEEHGPSDVYLSFSAETYSMCV